jgi:hypothetical protein
MHVCADVPLACTTAGLRGGGRPPADAYVCVCHAASSTAVEQYDTGLPTWRVARPCVQSKWRRAAGGGRGLGPSGRARRRGRGGLAGVLRRQPRRRAHHNCAVAWLGHGAPAACFCRQHSSAQAKGACLPDLQAQAYRQRQVRVLGRAAGLAAAGFLAAGLRLRGLWRAAVPPTQPGCWRAPPRSLRRRTRQGKARPPQGALRLTTAPPRRVAQLASALPARSVPTPTPPPPPAPPSPWAFIH